jgi:hypothetical protein
MPIAPTLRCIDAAAEATVSLRLPEQKKDSDVPVEEKDFSGKRPEWCRRPICFTPELELAVGTALRDCAQAGCTQCWFSL